MNFVPVAELEVRGLRERYRRTGIGAPLAASTAAFTPDAKLRDFVGRGTKVPVTALLRLDDPRRSLAAGRISGAWRSTTATQVISSRSMGSGFLWRSSPPLRLPIR